MSSKITCRCERATRTVLALRELASCGYGVDHERSLLVLAGRPSHGGQCYRTECNAVGGRGQIVNQSRPLRLHCSMQLLGLDVRGCTSTTATYNAAAVGWQAEARCACMEATGLWRGRRWIGQLVPTVIARAPQPQPSPSSPRPRHLPQRPATPRTKQCRSLAQTTTPDGSVSTPFPRSRWASTGGRSGSTLPVAWCVGTLLLGRLRQAR